MFSVITPAAAIGLLTIEQLRSAAGLVVGDGSRDAELQLMGDRVALDIATFCNIASDGLNPPTLLREEVSDSFDECSAPEELFLSRRFVSLITAIDENGTALVSSDFSLDRESGVVYRLQSGRRTAWPRRITTVTYVAGFLSPPADLQGAASDMVRIRLSQAERDPLLKVSEVEVPDIERIRNEYWVGSLAGQTAGSAIPDIVAGQLNRFRVIGIG